MSGECRWAVDTELGSGFSMLRFLQRREQYLGFERLFMLACFNILSD